ncbi:MAG: peroxiredoxin [Acidobacteriaceae bacterium]
MQRNGTWIILAVLVIAAIAIFAIKARAAEKVLQPGATAPDFTLPSQEDTPVSLQDYKGKWVVLYFYPKDMTPGCTIEAHNFQRDLEKYHAENAVILGVSFDTVESHKTFCTKDSLTFKLLADPHHKVIDSYGVGVTNLGVTKFANRTTFLINPEGKIAKVWTEVKPSHHSEEVLAELASLNKK